MKKIIKNVLKKQKENTEKGARQNLLEELFYDLNRSRVQIYKLNLVRGIFFGFGSVIGGTLVVAILIALLNLLVDLPGGIGDFIRYITEVVRGS